MCNDTFLLVVRRGLKIQHDLFEKLALEATRIKRIL